MNKKSMSVGTSRCTIFVALAFITLLLILSASCPISIAGKPVKPPVSDSFNISVADSRGWVGDYNRIAVDSNGKSHIVYYDQTYHQLKYVNNANGPWQSQVIDVVGSRYSGPLGGLADIVIDSNDNVHIIYENIDRNIIYTNDELGYFSPVQILGDTIAEGQMALVIDNGDKLHLAYYDFTDQIGKIRYANNVGGVWSEQLVDSRAGLFWDVEMTVDRMGVAHIIYTTTSERQLVYSNNAGAKWNTEVLDSELYTSIGYSIGSDSANKIYVSYFAFEESVFSDLSMNYLKLATRSSTGWTYSTIDTYSDPLRHMSSLAVDINDKVHISYNRNVGSPAKSTLMYVSNVEGPWKITTVDSTPNVGYCNDLGVDGGLSPKVHISYYDTNRIDLKYALSI